MENGAELFNPKEMQAILQLSAPIRKIWIHLDNCDAGLGKAFYKLRHGDKVLAGEDAVHQYHHRTLVCRWVKPIGQSDLIGNLALRTADGGFLRLATR